MAAIPLNPAGPILSRLGRIRNSDHFLAVTSAAGIVIDQTLNDRQNFSHSTRVREYLARTQARLAALPPDARLTHLFTLASELVRTGAMEESALALELNAIGWKIVEGHLVGEDPSSVAPAEGASLSRTAVILTALPLETAAVLEHLNSVHDNEHSKGTVYRCGTFSDGPASWRVAVVTTGMGNPTAALELERAISQFQPEIVLFVGVAGGLKDVKLGDVVAADKVHAYESGKAGEAFSPRPTSFQSSYAALQRAKQEAMKGTWLTRIKAKQPENIPVALVKPIAAGEKVIASDQASVYGLIRQTYGDAVAVEMEGAGFLLATHANAGVEALVVRGISDLISNKEASDAAGWQHIAARHAAAFAFEFLAQYRVIRPESSTDAAPTATTTPTSETRSARPRRVSRTKPPKSKGEPYDIRSSPAFFNARMCDAFPGANGVFEEELPARAIERLRALLAPTLSRDNNSPIWQVGIGNLPIHELVVRSGSLIQLDHDRYRVAKLMGYRSRFYWRDFSLLYWDRDEPTGLYGIPSDEEIRQRVQTVGSCTEEYGVWGSELITRREYDDGSVFRDGRPQKVSAQLEVRQLAPGATFIVAQLSPINDFRIDRTREQLLADHLAGKASVGDIVDWVETLRRL